MLAIVARPINAPWIGVTLSILVSVSSTLMLLVSPVPSATGANQEMTGVWRHDSATSDANYVSGEYPGRRLELAVGEDSIGITQTLGNVKDGIPLPPHTVSALRDLASEFEVDFPREVQV